MEATAGRNSYPLIENRDSTGTSCRARVQNQALWNKLHGQKKPGGGDV